MASKSLLKFSKNLFAASKNLKLLRNFHKSAPRQIALQYSPNSYFDKNITARLMDIPVPTNKTQVIYVWIDGSGEHLRNVDNVLHFVPRCLDQISNFEIDGSACYLAPCEDADIILKPIQMYEDPFRMKGNCKIILCETFKPSGEPAETNFRRCLSEALECVVEHDPYFGFEQDFTLLDMNKRPYGWPYPDGYPAPEGSYFAAVGGDKTMARDIIEVVFRASLYAGADFRGCIAGHYPGKWTIQIGHNEGIAPADDLWMARYLLDRVAEEYGVVVSYNPTPTDCDHWTDNRLLVGFSTLCTRQREGLKEIESAITKLCKNHLRHMQVYDPQCGNDLKRRDKDQYHEFSSGTADRETCISISRTTVIEKKGYFTDRRPSSNGDPYQVANALVRTILLDE